MASEKFIMVSLEDEKSKDLANVISNDTSRRILSYLSEKEASESDISKALGLPASTVHYNVQHMLKSNLIEVKDFYWSDKGNKVNVYTIAKKFIVIAPRGTKVNSALKSLIPVALFSLAAAAAIQFVSNNYGRMGAITQGAAKSVPSPVLEQAVMDQSTAGAPQFISHPTLWSNLSLWFLFGAVFAIIIYLIIYFVWRRK
jgi:hypothetical protein